MDGSKNVSGTKEIISMAGKLMNKKTQDKGMQTEMLIDETLRDSSLDDIIDPTLSPNPVNCDLSSLSSA